MTFRKNLKCSVRRDRQAQLCLAQTPSRVARFGRHNCCLPMLVLVSFQGAPMDKHMGATLSRITAPDRPAMNCSQCTVQPATVITPHTVPNDSGVPWSLTDLPCRSTPVRRALLHASFRSPSLPLALPSLSLSPPPSPRVLHHVIPPQPQQDF